MGEEAFDLKLQNDDELYLASIERHEMIEFKFAPIQRRAFSKLSENA
jgi:hypothetical protein